MAWHAKGPANDTADARSVEGLYRAHALKVRRRAAALLRSRDAAEDVLQEVFLRACRARPTFATADEQLRWLYRVTTNVCLNRLRDGNRRDQLLVLISPHDEAAASPSVDAALTVQALMSRVPASLRQMAVHYFVDEMTQDELSELLEVPRRTVGYRLEQFRTLTTAAAARS